MLFGNFAESGLKTFDEEEIDEEDYAEDYGYSSDSDLEDDKDEKFSWFKYVSYWMLLPFALFGLLLEDESSLCGERVRRAERGKVVDIPDMAFVT